MSWPCLGIALKTDYRHAGFKVITVSGQAISGGENTSQTRNMERRTVWRLCSLVYNTDATQHEHSALHKILLSPIRFIVISHESCRPSNPYNPSHSSPYTHLFLCLSFYAIPKNISFKQHSVEGITHRKAACDGMCFLSLSNIYMHTFSLVMVQELQNYVYFPAFFKAWKETKIW